MGDGSWTVARLVPVVEKGWAAVRRVPPVEPVLRHCSFGFETGMFNKMIRMIAVM
jgi:hypothetical protein